MASADRQLTGCQAREADVRPSARLGWLTGCDSSFALALIPPVDPMLRLWRGRGGARARRLID